MEKNYHPQIVKLHTLCLQAVEPIVNAHLSQRNAEYVIPNQVQTALKMDFNDSVVRIMKGTLYGVPDNFVRVPNHEDVRRWAQKAANAEGIPEAFENFVQQCAQLTSITPEDAEQLALAIRLIADCDRILTDMPQAQDQLRCLNDHAEDAGVDLADVYVAMQRTIAKAHERRKVHEDTRDALLKKIGINP